MLSVGDALLMVYQSYIHVIFILGWSFATYQSFVNGFQMEIKKSTWNFTRGIINCHFFGCKDIFFQ